MRFQLNFEEHDPEICFKNVTSWNKEGPCKTEPKFVPFGMNVSTNRFRTVNKCL